MLGGGLDQDQKEILVGENVDLGRWLGLDSHLSIYEHLVHLQEI